MCIIVAIANSLFSYVSSNTLSSPQFDAGPHHITFDRTTQGQEFDDALRAWKNAPPVPNETRGHMVRMPWPLVLSPNEPVTLLCDNSLMLSLCVLPDEAKRSVALENIARKKIWERIVVALKMDHVDNEFMTILGSVFKVMGSVPTLTTLNLGMPSVGDVGMRCAIMQHAATNFKNVNISELSVPIYSGYNPVDDQSAADLIRAFDNLTKLTLFGLFVETTPCHQHPCPQVIKAVEESYTITEADVNWISTEEYWGVLIEKSIHLVCVLNRAGRIYLRNDPANRSAGVNVLEKVNDNLDCLFFHLRENPSLIKPQPQPQSIHGDPP